MHGVELAVGDHLRERLLRTDAPHLEFRRQIERDLFLAAGLFLASGPVLAARGVDAVLVLQDSANPHGRGHLVLRDADSLAGELLRLADAALRGDENARVPEKARWKNGDGDEGGVLTHERHAIRGQRHLRRVELAVAQHPEKRLLDEEFVIDEVDALGTHAAVGERSSTVVVPAGEGELESGHAAGASRPSPDRYRAPEKGRASRLPCRAARPEARSNRSEERRVGKECRSRWSPYH